MIWISVFIQVLYKETIYLKSRISLGNKIFLEEL